MAGSNPVHCGLLVVVILLLVCYLRRSNANSEGMGTFDCDENSVNPKDGKVGEPCSRKNCCSPDLTCKRDLGFFKWLVTVFQATPNSYDDEPGTCVE